MLVYRTTVVCTQYSIVESRPLRFPDLSPWFSRFALLVLSWRLFRAVIGQELPTDVTSTPKWGIPFERPPFQRQFEKRKSLENRWIPRKLMVFLSFLACPDWRKGHGFPDFFPSGNRSGLALSKSERKTVLLLAILRQAPKDRN